MISLLIPTRNRPDNLKRLVNSLINTTEDINNIELCFYVDSDDVVSVDVITDIAEKIKCQCLQGDAAPNVRVSHAITQNSLQKIATGPIFMFSADDIVFHTRGWDKMVINQFDKFEDKIALVYGPDGFQTGDVPVCTHGFLHRHWVDVIGYFFPYQFSVAYHDQWVTEIADALGRRCYIKDLNIEHVHPAAGKAAWDSTYLTKQESTGGERNIYNNTRAERLHSIDLLKKYIAIFEKHE